MFGSDAAYVAIDAVRVIDTDSARGRNEAEVEEISINYVTALLPANVVPAPDTLTPASEFNSGRVNFRLEVEKRDMASLPFICESEWQMNVSYWWQAHGGCFSWDTDGRHLISLEVDPATVCRTVHGENGY